MKEILEPLATWARRGEAAATATVVAVHRSTPRPPGAKMAVSAGGEVAGMVSGGCVEGAVVQAAHEVLAGGPARLLHFGIADADAWSVGLPCGGEIAVWVETHDPASEFIRIANDGGRATQITAVAGPHLGAKLLVREDGRATGDLQVDAETLSWARERAWAERSELRHDLFADAVFPPPRLIIFGAVDYAVALCRLARACGWCPYVIDPRGFFARAERFPEAVAVLSAWPEEGMMQLGGIDRATSVVVLTHDPKLDDAAISLALRSPARYIGAMGSRRANAGRRDRLLAAGFNEEDLARLSQPIGLDIGAFSAEETALSIMAEVTAVRNGRDGGRLCDSTGPIHDLVAAG